ncbi:hypothetical protein R1L06_05490 [Stenotrophomonas sp. C4297]|uniref:hypothetical protein n=1 Tax=Stenotrophomonas TaxID=40323 RepID=UPI0015F606CB|nr:MULTISPECIES: hypothetical protein [Stenotrophomonas]MBH1635272.1 hypothetical protein [Stenotrophomonas maltophilia]MDV3510169.1 hypothetical protein [Stenotrophomonas sp. C4297]
MKLAGKSRKPVESEFLGNRGKGMNSEVKEILEASAAVATILGSVGGALLFVIKRRRRKDSEKKEEESGACVPESGKGQSQVVSNGAVAIQAGGSVMVNGGIGSRVQGGKDDAM